MKKDLPQELSSKAHDFTAGSSKHAVVQFDWDKYKGLYGLLSSGAIESEILRSNLTTSHRNATRSARPSPFRSGARFAGLDRHGDGQYVLSASRVREKVQSGGVLAGGSQAAADYHVF